MPKLQAGCTLTAQDGMVVRTAQSSAKAAEGQNATLEFILVNHPLDCPVCDKGGECPLQDLTFRYGPGPDADDVPEAHVRQADPDLADDRARPRALHPLLPLHALLLRRRRGRAARREEPRRAVADRDLRGRELPRAVQRQRDRALPGRRAHLDPVPLRGAAVGDPERPDRLRPLPGRLQHPRDDARGQGQADPLAQPSRGRPGLALRQGPLRLPAPLRRTTGSSTRSSACAAAASSELSWDDALDRAEALLRGAQGRIVTALSGSETVEQAYALGKLLRQGLGAHSAVLPEATSSALDAFRAPLSAIADAEIVVVVGDEEVAERAPIVDLWIKQARRNGAEVVRVAEPKLGEELEERVAASDRAVLIWSGRGGGGGARLAELGAPARPRRQARLRRLPPAATPNGRGVAEAWAAAADGRRGEPGADRAADRLRRRGRVRPGRARARRAGGARARDHDVPRPRGRLGRPRPARARATSSATARSSTSRAACSGCAAP